MEFNPVELISQVGFPIAMTLILIFKGFKTLDNITISVNKLNANVCKAFGIKEDE